MAEKPLRLTDDAADAVFKSIVEELRSVFMRYEK